MIKKYTLVNCDKPGFKQIKYSKGFSKRIGIPQLGGYLDSYNNLNQDGDCLVSGNARVSMGDHSSFVIIIALPQFRITDLNTHLQIGCQVKTKEEWKLVTKEQAIEMGLREENYELFRRFVLCLTTV